MTYNDPFVIMFREILVGHIKQIARLLPDTAKVSIFIRDKDTDVILAAVSHDELEKIVTCLIKNRSKMKDGTERIARPGPPRKV